jgi:hemoglobin
VSSSVYDRLGGAPAIDKAVDIFYEKVLADERIKHFFEGVNMVAQRQKQKAFLTMAFGGPNNYTGLSMRRAHSPLVERGLNDAHVDAVIENLGAVLTVLGAQPGDIEEVARIANSVRDDVLGR